MDPSLLEVASCSDQESGRGVHFEHRSKAISADPILPAREDACFQCNICLESAHDPVVTLCGHLYCWPCIYKWLHVHISHEEYQSQKCPVCKAKISSASLVPLYGRGSSKSSSRVKEPESDPFIPRRPSSIAASASHSNHHLNQEYFQSQQSRFRQEHYFPEVYRGLSANPSFLGGTAITSLLLNPTTGTFGEMMFSRIFGSTGGTLFPSYSIGSSNPRIRRHEFQVEKSLSRISFFLLCCVVSCLLLF